ncbi:hypothetical protein TBR22_A38460 [Luteitalea sp. TBR-22]|uniref:serine/threonine-protein kinase n=1 Tax=Luteitalea sp. TBR-22 TaxID=2802971 RepID=UPI001AF34A40|nr:serine/threonine-protein kinase [Luteitalea sp. TBR-22]BCS34618.1 hypothetical protein TBR22_A38460 [Luteitalea sp. TBR-22]
MTAQHPVRISHYEIQRVLGQGGMGLVYLALDPGLQRQVALKVLRADSDDHRERFRREARIVARLQHPNIVQIYAVGEHEQQLFIAMEYIDGEPLSEGLRRRAPWSLQRRLMMAADLCAGLAFAHRAGVVHRDVKPSNLMVANGSGTVRLLDFGIARGADSLATMGLTQHGNIVGTLNYMSPEQITGQPLDHRSDIFAVGAVLYELLAYRQAFPGDNLATLTYRIVHLGPDPLRTLQPDLDPALYAVVERAMARQPEDRYPHLEALRTDLLGVVSRLDPAAAGGLAGQGAPGTGATPQPVIWSRALDPTVLADTPGSPRSTAALAETETETALSQDTGRRRTWPRVAAIGSLVAAGALAAWVTVGRGGAPAPDRPGAGGTDGGGTVTRPNDPIPEAPRPGRDAPPVVAIRPEPGAIDDPAPRAGERTPERNARGEPPPIRPDRRKDDTPPDSGRQVGGGSGSVTPPTDFSSLPPVQPGQPPATEGPGPLRGADSGGAAAGTAALPPVVTGPSDEDQVQSVLARWARAYAARDARGVDEVQPGTAGTLEKQFAALSRVDVTLSGCRIDVQGPRASAECGEQFTAETRFGGKPTSEARRRSFVLDKTSGTWRITAARIVR